MSPTLLYDGDCRFCRFAARVVVAWDRKGVLGVLSFTDPEAAPLLAGISERLTSWHLVQPDGRCASRGRGVLELLALLPATRPLAPLLSLLPLEALYDLVSRNRGRLGRLVPDGPAPSRRPRAPRGTSATP